jgi:tetratricopeptide (TPR) repeat protein
MIKAKNRVSFGIIISFFSLVAFASGETNLNAEIPDLAQLEVFALQIEESIENGNPSYFNNSFDIDAFLNKVMNENSSTEDNLFNKGFEEGFRKNFDLGTMIVDEIKNDGSYTFLRAYKKDSTIRLLFRLFTHNGINYHEFEVKHVQGDFRITDAYLFLSGERISETISRMYNSYRFPDTSPPGESINSLKALAELGKIKVLASKGKYRKAYNIWQKLPPSYKNDKIFQITGIQIASYLDNKKYLETFKEFVTNYPANTDKYLIPLDGFIIHQNYSMALACIDSLDKSLNNDPLLNYLRGNLFYEMGNHSEAANKLSVLIEALPDFEPSYYSLLALYIGDNNYIKATHVLDKIIFRLNYYKNDISTILQEYPAFINSEEFQVWMNR